jgi:putative transcriptional regulator
VSKKSKLTDAILETADDMVSSGIISQRDHEKITMRHLKRDGLPAIELMSSEEIKSIRRKAHLSQAAFASYLNLTVGYISQLERGLKEPTGPVLVLLNVIRRKGFDVIAR